MNEETKQAIDALRRIVESQDGKITDLESTVSNLVNELEVLKGEMTTLTQKATSSN